MVITRNGFQKMSESMAIGKALAEINHGWMAGSLQSGE